MYLYFHNDRMDGMRTLWIALFLGWIGVGVSAQDFYQQEITDEIFARIDG